MKKINLIKVTLDIIMSIIFVLLFNKMVVAGLIFHEIAGLAIGFFFILHLLPNWKWIKQVTLSLFAGKLSLKTKIGYLVNVLLLVFMTVIIVSGILISKALFTNLWAGGHVILKVIHISSSYASLMLIGIHVGLHWNWVMQLPKRMFKIPKNRRILAYIARLAVILILVFGAYNLYSVDYFSRISFIGGGPDKNHAPMNNGGINKMSPAGGGEQAFAKAPDMQNGREGFPTDKRSFEQPDILKVLSTFLSIIAVFSIITFYIEKLWPRKRMCGLPA